MADNNAPAQDVPGVDFSEHTRTYEGFVALTVIGILHALTILLALVMFGFGGAGASAPLIAWAAMSGRAPRSPVVGSRGHTSAARRTGWPRSPS